MTKSKHTLKRYTMNRAFFDNIQSRSQAFWLGFLTAHGSLFDVSSRKYRAPNYHRIITISALNAASYTGFCDDLDSNYKLSCDTVKINSKPLYNSLILALNHHYSIPANLEVDFLSGLLANAGFFRTTLTANSNGNGKSYSYWEVESIDLPYIQFISKMLDKHGIKYSPKSRQRKANTVYAINIGAAKELIKFFELVNRRPNYHLYSDTMSRLKVITDSYRAEFDSRVTLFSMIRNDFDQGITLTSIAAKYSLRCKVVKRIIAGQTDVAAFLINASKILANLSLTLCSICHIYTDDVDNCIYCDNPTAHIYHRNYETVGRDYSSQIRAGMINLLAGRDISNLTIQKHTGWTFAELKTHLESQFEPWMNWDNWKQYSARKWDDSDQKTWVWHIDHIRPQSLFKFTDKTDPLFKECWALDNLRPYSGKQNAIDGASKIRHTNKKVS